MKFYDKYRVIAVAERASGNECTGTSWLETKTFRSTDFLADVIDWARELMCNGKLILTVEEKRDGEE